MACNLIHEATEGYTAHRPFDCPYLEWSPSWMAWTLGRFLSAIGAEQPRKVHMGRGYKVNCDGMMFRIHPSGGISQLW